jgi:hypothetical protein
LNAAFEVSVDDEPDRSAAAHDGGGFAAENGRDRIVCDRCCRAGSSCEPKRRSIAAEFRRSSAADELSGIPGLNGAKRDAEQCHFTGTRGLDAASRKSSRGVTSRRCSWKPADSPFTVAAFGRPFWANAAEHP